MFVAAAQIVLHLPNATSLKDKRAVVQSLTARLRHEYGLAAAEVDHLDNHQLAVIGLSVVSNEAGHAENVLRTAIRYIETSRPDLEVTSVQTDVAAPF